MDPSVETLVPGDLDSSEPAGPAPFILQQEGDGKRRVVRCTGELDISNGGCLEKALTACVESGTLFVELDFRGVSFLDSGALRIVVLAHWRMAAASQQLRV